MAKKKSKLVKHIKKHLFMDVAIPVIALVVLLLLVVIKVPYTAKETYTELVETPVQKTEIDTENPIEQRVCNDVPANVKVEPDPFSPYMKPFGLHDQKCYAQVRIWNEEETDGKWTVKYIFDVSGKIVETEPQEKLIPKIGSVTFEFETEECQEGDTVTGDYEIVASPTTEECEYETIYPSKTVTVMEKKEEPRERLLTKYEPLWQKLLGYNKHEKV